MLPKLRIKTEKLIDAETGNQKRDRQAGRVEGGKYQSALPTAAGRCQANDAAQNWPDTWCPARSERNSQGERAQHAMRLFVRELPRVFV